jgi:ribosomal protein S18 acetylase RimI-like enzyme
VERLLATTDDRAERAWLSEPLQRGHSVWHHNPLLKVLDIFPGQWNSPLRTFVVEQADHLVGLIQVAPVNQARSTWRVERICLAPATAALEAGTQLLRYCLENIWEARTWLVEVEVNHVDVLGLYRHNGFQPLAQLTRWQIPPDALAELALRSPNLPNLLPVNNADAALLHQLDTAAMPPFVRQVFDRHVQDFQRGLFNSLVCNLQTQIYQREWITGYVFEPQRKAAIGSFSIGLSRGSTETHTAQMTVHPAYTWLYPELLAHMAHLSQQLCPSAAMALVSADYQPEREGYLQQMGALRMEHTLMLSRSVWHKVRESKTLSLETLQLTEMLQGLQPNHTPVPGRMTFLTTIPSPFQTQVGGLRAASEHRPTAQDSTRRSERRASRSSSDMPDPHGSCG